MSPGGGTAARGPSDDVFRVVADFDKLLGRQFRKVARSGQRQGRSFPPKRQMFPLGGPFAGKRDGFRPGQPFLAGAGETIPVGMPHRHRNRALSAVVCAHDKLPVFIPLRRAVARKGHFRQALCLDVQQPRGSGNRQARIESLIAFRSRSAHGQPQLTGFATANLGNASVTILIDDIGAQPGLLHEQALEQPWRQSRTQGHRLLDKGIKRTGRCHFVLARHTRR